MINTVWMELKSMNKGLLIMHNELDTKMELCPNCEVNKYLCSLYINAKVSEELVYCHGFKEKELVK
jgi:hypothetical protein